MLGIELILGKTDNIVLPGFTVSGNGFTLPISCEVLVIKSFDTSPGLWERPLG